MAFSGFPRAFIFSIGLGWGLLSGLIFSSSSYLQAWEKAIHESVVKLRSTSTVPNQILLVTLEFDVPKAQSVDQKALDAFLSSDQDLLTDQFQHLLTHLVPLLIDQERANMVVLNAPPQWPPPWKSDRPSLQLSQTGDWLHDDVTVGIRQVLERYHPRLVLVNSVSQLGRNQQPEIANYASILPFDDEAIEPKVLPWAIQGFWSEHAGDKWRATQFVGQFRVGSTGTTQTFSSMPWLVYQKLNRLPQRWSELKSNPIGPSNSNAPPIEIPASPSAWMYTPVWIPFSGRANTFPRQALTLSPHCQTQDCYQSALTQLKNLKHKILLIDIAGSAIKTPAGPLLTQEVQANVLTSLMQDTFVRDLGRQRPRLMLGVVAALALLLDFAIVWNIQAPQRRWIRVLGLGLPGVWLMGAIVYVALGWMGVLLPIVLPAFTWTGTIIATSLCSFIWQREQTLTQNQRELERLRSETEEKALILKTQTLLRRIAYDIHGGPLQDLRAAIFEIESLKRSHPQLEAAPILEMLVDIGQSVRQQLNNVQEMASKLKMTPQLRNGLATGIRQTLQEMVESGRLTLQVQQDILPLVEPELNTLWIAAREDIFRFFCEAINNVVGHAQPPYGNATQVAVSLTQTGEHCRLAIANDGTIAQPQDTADSGLNGQGTKAMVEIAQDLPRGQWSRTPTPSGGLSVELCWLMDFQPERA